MEVAVLSTSFDNTEEDWTGLSDQKRRKQLQNRINQRAHRARKLRAQLAAILPEHSGKNDPRDQLPREDTTIVLNRSPSSNLYQDASLSSVEWEILLFARHKLWQQPCNPSHWGHSEPALVCRSMDDLWSRRLFEVPVLRHSVILVTCLDLEFLTGRDYTTIRLRHANATIRQIMTGISSDNSSCPTDSRRIRQDEVLFAIMSLAKTSISTSITPSRGTFGLFDPPFPLGLQFLNLWGQQTSNHTHCMAMQHIMRSRDHLAHNMGIETPGFAEALYQFDLLESAKLLNRPWMPVPTARLDLLRREIGVLRGELDVQERFIQAVPRISNYGPLLDILCDIHLCCSRAQTMQDETEPGSTAKLPYPTLMRDFATLRDTIEHRLLAYKPIENSTEEQVCWTVALIFTHCVIYSVPNRGPVEILLDRLVAILQILDLHNLRNVDEKFLAWVSMIGAMACRPTDDVRRPFFLESLISHTTAMRISSWVQLKSILQGFLWLDRACDAGGPAIWSILSSSVPEAVGIPRRTSVSSSTGSLAHCIEAQALGQSLRGDCMVSTAPMHSVAMLGAQDGGGDC